MAHARGELDGSVRELVESNQGFVAKVAHTLRHRAVPFEDLMSEGNLGLLEAARRYDRGRGTGFLSYAVWWIRKRMLAAIASQQSLVRISDHEARRLRGSGDDFAPGRLRRDAPPVGVPGAKSRSDPRRPIYAPRAGRPADLSLDQAIGADGGSPLSSFLADISAGSPEEILLRSEAHEVVRNLLCGLPQRHREIVRMRFGFDGGDPTTLEQAGRRVGLTRERVRQIERQSLARIRRGLMAGWSGNPHGGAKGRAPEPPSVSNVTQAPASPPRPPRQRSESTFPQSPVERASTA